MRTMKQIGKIAAYSGLVLTLTFLAACSSLSVSEVNEQAEETDYSCAYFYFLWGKQAELSLQYEEALEAYQKALICDPEAERITRKIPVLLLRLDRGEEAVGMLEAYLAEKPADTSTRMLLARVYIGLGRYKKAIEQYRTIHKQDPTEVGALLLLSELYLNQSDLVAAEQTLRQVVRVNSGSYAARVLLARIYLNTKRYDEAEEEYDKALQLNWSVDLLMEKVDVYREQEEYDKAIALYQEILDEDQGNERVTLALVNLLLRIGRQKEALAELNRIKNKAGLNEKVEMSVAQLFARLEKYDQAVEILQKLLQKEEDAAARYLLAVILTHTEKYEEALAALQKIGTEDEVFENSILLQVRILRFLGRPEDAIVLLEKAVVDEENRSPDMYVMLAALYHVQNKTEMGRRTFDRAMSAFPDNNDLLYEYGLFLDSTGRLEEAMSTMQEVISRQPSHGEALNYVGYSWADQSVHLDKALEYIERAAKLEPENGYIRDSLGWVYYRLGRLDDARKALEQAVKLLEDDPAIRDHLGDVYLELGRKADAIRTYRKGLSLFGDKEADELKKSIQEKLHLLEEQGGK